MKLSDILVEAKRNLMVLQSGQDFRVDPNPDHTLDLHGENVWTQDVSQAHVFREKSARRFLLRREEMAREKRMHHTRMKMVPVILDTEGRPTLPQAERKPSMLDRLKRKKEVA